MKTKITILIAFLFLSFNVSFAQDNAECITKLSVFHEFAKSKNYGAAYEPWSEVRSKCPNLNLAIYTDGEKILKDKLKTATGTEKTALINDLVSLWEKRAELYPAKTKKGEFAAKACQLKFDNKDLLGLKDTELYDCFDAAYQSDEATFTSPKSLYAYFSLMVNLFDAGAKPAKEMFTKYDEIVEKVEKEVDKSSAKLNELVAKEESGAVLGKKELRYKSFYSRYLKNYAKISKSIDKKLGDRANCENLIPLYERDFAANSTNVLWLKRVVSKLYKKGCTDTPLYEKVVKAFDQTEPSADTKYFVATLLIKKGKTQEAETYLNQSYELQTDPYKKGKLAYRIGKTLRKKGKLSQARTYFRDAVKLNPSNGRPHLDIAAMYARSAKNCGDTNFNKRAVYWLAAQEAQKASRVDPTLSKVAAQTATSYKAKAPSKSEIFSESATGKTIKIGCWIGASVTVPSL